MNELNGFTLSIQSMKYIGRDAIKFLSAHPCHLQTLLHINKEENAKSLKKKQINTFNEQIKLY